MLYRAATNKDRVLRWIAVCDCNPEIKVPVKASQLTHKASCGCVDSHAQMNLEHHHTRQSANRLGVIWPASDAVAVALCSRNASRLVTTRPFAFSPSELPLAA